jgi:hypothetical protein
MLTKFPELSGDIEYPPYVDYTRVSSVNIWIGGGDNVTPFHCDQSDNLLAQVVGKKRVLLASPAQRAKMYPFGPFRYALPIFSRIDTSEPNPSRFPRFQEVDFLTGTILPGEMLFIPVHWWHEVRGLDVNISVNFWWHASRRNMWRYPTYVLSSSAHSLWRAIRTRMVERGSRSRH